MYQLSVFYDMLMFLSFNV